MPITAKQIQTKVVRVLNFDTTLVLKDYTWYLFRYHSKKDVFFAHTHSARTERMGIVAVLPTE